MATVLDVVTRALRVIGVAAVDRPAEAEETAVAFQALNDMLAGWKAFGVDIEHVDYADTADTFETALLTSEYRDHVVYLLARRVAPEFGVALTGEAMQAAEMAQQAIYSGFHEATDLVVDRGLQVMPSQYWGLWRTRSL